MLDWSAEDREIKEYEGGRNDSNQRHGQGRALLPNGDVYEGKYRNGKRHGGGLYVFRGGARYEGQWKKGVKHGEGRFHYPDGSWYEGEWKRDMRHGYGAYHYPNGDVYEGSWRKNLRHGLGTYTYQSSGTKFMGSWVDETMEGRGQLIHPKHRYHGTWGKNLGLLVGQRPGERYFVTGGFPWDVGQEPGERCFVTRGFPWNRGLVRGTVTRGFPWDRGLVRGALSLGAFHGTWGKNLPEGPGVYTFSLKWMQLGQYVHMKVSDQDLAEALDEERAEEGAKDPSAIPRGVVALWRATKVGKYDPSLLPAEPVPVTITDSVQSIESVEPPEGAGVKAEEPSEGAGENREEPPEEAEETLEEPQAPEQDVQGAERLASQELQEGVQPEPENVQPEVSVEDNPETEDEDF
uniref:Radial spoke head 1 homolog n=1 Tax=Timema shepardi TaxID=629360 RepID=A0A7R9AW51_TIMSH|nr:unnamed protein product [Timema shepardi]